MQCVKVKFQLFVKCKLMHSANKGFYSYIPNAENLLCVGVYLCVRCPLVGFTYRASGFTYLYAWLTLSLRHRTDQIHQRE